MAPAKSLESKTVMTRTGQRIVEPLRSLVEKIWKRLLFRPMLFGRIRYLAKIQRFKTAWTVGVKKDTWLPLFGLAMECKCPTPLPDAIYCPQCPMILCNECSNMIHGLLQPSTLIPPWTRQFTRTTLKVVGKGSVKPNPSVKILSKASTVTTRSCCTRAASSKCIPFLMMLDWV